MKRKNHLLAALMAIVCIAAPARAQSDDAIARLSALGYLRSGSTDVASAVHSFQTANALEPTGSLDAETLAALQSADAISKSEYLSELAQRYPDQALSSGDTGQSVLAMQERLIELGYYAGKADGVFGDGTRRAVTAFQTANGLYANGEADRAVLWRLFEGQTLSMQDFIAGKVCTRGDSGANVRSLQRRLRRLGYYDGECSNSFGEATQRAVTLFQQQNGLSVSGEADEETCQLLYCGEPTPLKDDGTLREGDSGQEVLDLQSILGELGYACGDEAGTFGHGTVVALTQFQVANGLEPTGEAQTELVSQMRAQEAVPFSEATEAMRASESGVTEQTLAQAAAMAADMLGKQFVVQTSASSSGFAFAQYIYARLGVALSEPNRVLYDAALMTDASSAQAGCIIALEAAGDSGAPLLFAVCLGGTRVAYADAQTGYVLSGDLSSMEYSSAYVWTFYGR